MPATNARTVMTIRGMVGAYSRATCPDDLRYDGLEGCGSNNVEGPDFEGFYDCLNCGLFFVADPMQMQGTQPIAKAEEVSA
jgi:hypothetical protein